MRPGRRQIVMLVVMSTTTAAGIVGFACGFDGESTKVVEKPGIDRGDPPSEASLPDSSVDGTVTDGGMDAETGPVKTCPTTHGPTMVLIPDGGFCIDSTEVTNQQYDEFLVATNGGAADGGIPEGGLPPRCNGIKTFKRFGPAADAGVKTPVVNIPWCAAAAYCEWAGKRLCGGGPPGVYDKGEWYVACSNDGAQSHAYGNAFVSGVCNEDAVLGTVEPVASRSGCEGGVPGLFDMMGNVYEWVDNCDGPGDASSCATQGTFFNSVGNLATCASFKQYITGQSDYATGIRCCATPQ